MKRRQLLRTLKKVAPALSGKDFIPSFACFLFDGECVTATDDRVMLQAPCEWEVKGGILGVGLIAQLEASSTRRDVSAKQSGTEIAIRMGGKPVKMDILPVQEFNWSLPQEEGVEVEVDEHLIECVRKCLISVSSPTGENGWVNGVTVSFAEKRMSFYSCDGVTASRAVLRKKPPEELVGRAVQLEEQFCRQLVSIDRGEYGYAQKLIVHDDWAEAAFESQLLLFARNLNTCDAARHRGMFDKHKQVQTVPIPDGFDQYVDKALAVLGPKDEKLLKLSCGGEKLTFEARGKGGKFTDSTPLDDPLADYTAKCNPEHIKRVLDYVDQFALGNPVVFRGGAFDHLVGEPKKG